MATPSYIVFQCYGSESIFHECTYALLSLSQLYAQGMPADTEIWIYTDKPEWFKDLKGCTLPLNFRTVDQQQIQAWRGKIDFVHRVKVEVLKDMCSKKEGSILYLDTDIVFTHHIDKMLADIAAGKLYMHVMEGVVSDGSNPIFKKLAAYLHKSHTKVKNKPLHDMAMWNAGVLGFHTRHKHLLDEVLAFTDKVHPEFPKHIVEQFAFSVFFQQTGDVKAAAPYIVHYWNLKEVRVLLASFFNYFKDKSWGELVQYSILIQMHVLMQEKVNYLHNLGIIDKLQKKKWQAPQYNWTVLSKQL